MLIARATVLYWHKSAVCQNIISLVDDVTTSFFVDRLSCLVSRTRKSFNCVDSIYFRATAFKCCTCAIKIAQTTHKQKREKKSFCVGLRRPCQALPFMLAWTLNFHFARYFLPWQGKFSSATGGTSNAISIATLRNGTALKSQKPAKMKFYN